MGESGPRVEAGPWHAAFIAEQTDEGKGMSISITGAGGDGNDDDCVRKPRERRDNTFICGLATRCNCLGRPDVVLATASFCMDISAPVPRPFKWPRRLARYLK